MALLDLGHCTPEHLLGNGSLDAGDYGDDGKGRAREGPLLCRDLSFVPYNALIL